MKLLKLIMLFPILLFSYEIEFSKKFTQELPHDILSAYLAVTIEDKTESIVSQRLEVFNKKIKTYDKVEKKLGIFNIRPKYKHSNNTPRVSGYTGELRYKISSNQAMPLNELISEISSMKENRDTSVSLYNLSWSVKEETYDVTLDLLRFKAITWIQNYAKNLSNNLDLDCKIKKININTTRQIMPLASGVAYTSKAKSLKTIPVPEANQEQIKINPRYIMECE